MKNYSVSIINHGSGYTIKVNGNIFMENVSSDDVKKLSILDIIEKYENR